MSGTLAVDMQRLDSDGSDTDKNVGVLNDYYRYKFKQVMGCVILANALQIGAEHQWTSKQYHFLADVYLSFDCVFAALYTIEVLYKLYDQRCIFFCKVWSYIDTTLTVLAIYSAVVDFIGSKSYFQNTKALRLIRFIRIIRLIRVLSAVPDLVMVVEGLIRAFKSLSWVLLLIFSLVYIFAVFFTVEIHHDYEDDFRGIDYFSDMSHTMMTLVDIALLTEWSDVVRPVMKRQPGLLPFFFLFALLTSFAMLNVMIGVIVDSTGAARRAIDVQCKRVEMDDAFQIWIEKMKAGGITEGADAQDENQRDIVVLEIMQSLLDRHDSIPFPTGLKAEDLISLMDFDASGKLSFKEFQQGLERLFLGDSFQLTCLMLTVMGKLRRERTDAQTSMMKRLKEVLQRIDKIQETQAAAKAGRSK